ncbi:MAG: hypothetical protein APF81_22255 [Desulfosporosinus sp. BRH_c37]|nr:MAG: hypothetical protein APF81_22255 [Desulfosporosinus sp. BRH_c37]
MQFSNKLLGFKPRLIKMAWWVILALGLLVIPSFLSNYAISVVNNTLITIIAVAGLNLLTGYTGLISMGNAAFLGIGGFVAGIFSVQFGFPFWLAILVGGFAAMLIGVLIGIPALRLKGFYLLLATLALHFITVAILVRYQTWKQAFYGIRFPRMQVASFVFDTQTKSYYLFLVITVLVIVLIYNIQRTALGRSFVATRDNEAAAKAMGVNITYTKLVSFALSSFLIGISGGLMGFNVRNITADVYSLNVTIDQTVALFLGGQATLLGPVYGAAFVTMIPDLIDFLANIANSAVPLLGKILETYKFEIRTFIFGLSIVLVLIFKPGGLAEIFGDLKSLFIKNKISGDGGEPVAGNTERRSSL